MTVRASLKERKPVAPLAPGATIGILGGGQLGRMLIMAAARLGLSTHVYCTEADAPAAQLAATVTHAAFDDEAALRAFADATDVVTYEFENVPFETVAFLAEIAAVRPGPRALKVAQDRLQEKTFLNGINIPTTHFAPVNNGGELVTALQKMGVPSVLKTRRMGYDGKGQVVLEDMSDRENAWDTVGRAASILEVHVPFLREVSVIAARSAHGDVACYDVTENIHRGHVLRRSLAPARVNDATERRARGMASQIVTALDYIGVMGIELFELEDGSLLVNEIAPRVHNSGHWTLDACAVSQFEQHIRAVAGWPLGSTGRHSDAVMENILGAEADNWGNYLEHPDSALHLYGKREAREGRKMGHVTRLFPLGRLPDL